MFDAKEERVSFAGLCQWTARQLEATRAADTHQYTLFGGSRGPGKSYWLRWYLLRKLLKLAKAGIRGAVVGLFCEDYPSLQKRHLGKISQEFPLWLGELKESQAYGLGFHLRPDYGGGVLACCNLDDPAKYQSAEFAGMGVDELTRNQVEIFNILRGSLRWPGVPQPGFAAATTPGNLGHLWVKDYWVDRNFPNEMQGIADRFAFVRALPDDNPHLDGDYWEMLETLPEDLAKAWRWGSWDIFAGQAFSLFRREIDGQAWHVVAPFAVAAEWPKWRGLDWGRSNPFACLWVTQDPSTGRVFVYREAYKKGLTDRAQARLVKSLTEANEKIARTEADPSMWTKKTHEDTTFSTADEYAAEKVPLTKADNDRMTGKRKIDLLLEPLDDGLPGLQIFSTCTNLIRTLPALPVSPLNPEDVDSSAEDHLYDALKYALSRVVPRPRRRLTDKPKATLDPVLKKLRGGQGLHSSDL